ncbi:capsular biosynthesis protein [Hanstruepera neustonica]|uniref:Capsular biosynthesis protein n=1 Tax=Hanstruepera neustonica TaxID=1445657 RepID=A0A2K1DVM6_9FLAO|nr:glycosyltransferase [Hanstruepera neustonica]PNQ72090.1 capsular biosynthesis protein [Hanstruepera neustonica]
MRLTIISHTEHFMRPDGVIVGLGSTVTEINHLLDVFDTITHVAMLHEGEAPPSALPYISNNIRFVALPAVGGPRTIDKLGILLKAPKILQIVKTEVRASDYFQFRAPTGIGVFVIPYLMFFGKTKGWFKYAGNWIQSSPPLAYRFQKWLLTKQHRLVTINGVWSKQPKHCLSFENPCLTTDDLRAGNVLVSKKEKRQGEIQLCFVGRLEEAKGIGFLIEAIRSLHDEEKSQIKQVHIVGDGKQKFNYLELAKEVGVRFKFYGVLSRKEVHDIYKVSHAIILPSASEGFPKVIAEAMNYGCLPIVSNVSSIGHYIKHQKNGFLLRSIDSEGTCMAIQEFLKLSNQDYSLMTQYGIREINVFSYPYYNSRISNDIL